MQSIWINGKHYEWRVGRSHVLIRSDGQKVASPDFSELLGLDWHSIEHDKWKGTLRITPADVAGYILTQS